MAAATSFLLALAGALFLALAMHRHAQAQWDRAPTTRHRATLRLAGAATLLLSAVIILADAGWAFGLMLWPGLLAPAFGLAALWLSIRPKAAAGLAFSAVLTGLATHAVMLALV